MSTVHEATRRALADQVEAANVDQVRMIRTLVRALDPVDADPSAFALALLGRLAARFVDGRLTMCEHWSPLAPQPAFWAPSQPGRLRCMPCHLYAGRRLAGTDKDHSCDQCGRYAFRGLLMASLSLPGGLVDLAPGLPPVALPPTTILFGQCSACRASDHALWETA